MGTIRYIFLPISSDSGLRGAGFNCTLNSTTLTYLNLTRVLLLSGMAQMTLTNMPNEILAFNAFEASLPTAVNHGVSTQFPDTMCIP